jgi:polygalacturonase
MEFFRFSMKCKAFLPQEKRSFSVMTAGCRDDELWRITPLSSQKAYRNQEILNRKPAERQGRKAKGLQRSDIVVSPWQPVAVISARAETVKGYLMKSLTLLRKTIITILAVALVAAVLSLGAFAEAATASSAGVVNSKTLTLLSTADAAQSGFDVTKAGATGTDSGDDTAAIQSALDQYDSVTIPGGVYYINADVSLHLKSNQTLTLSDGATLQALPSAQEGYAVIDINNASNVTLTGGRIVGDRAVHQGTGGEWGMGISVENGASNITISNITISDCWGDGVYLGDGASIVRDIRLSGVICDNNRRQGLSITGAAGVTITGCTFKNTNGTAPSAGIDLEPYGEYTVDDITITDTKCIGNAGSGLDIVGGKYAVSNVFVSGSVFSDNAGGGIRAWIARNIQLSDSIIQNNHFGIEFPNDVSNVKCTGLTITGNRSRGVSLVTSSQKGGVSDIVFESTTFSNNSQGSSNIADGIRIDKYDDSGYIRGVVFKGCRFIDDQKVKTQCYGLSVGLSCSGISDVVVDSACVFSGNITGDYIAGDALRFM